jgi:PTS system ascorbate-specific IIB component
MEDVKITVVCGAGAGSSAILMINAKKALASLGVKGNIETSALYLISAQSPDIILTSQTFVEKIKEKIRDGKIPIVPITSFVDINEITKKLEKPLKDLGFLK